MRTFVLFLLFYTIITISKAQQILDAVYVTDPNHSVMLQGVIKNIDTNQPIDSVAVYIFGSDGTNIKSYTDDKGNFNCFLRASNYKLSYIKQNYRTLIEVIEFVHSPDTIRVIKFLEPDIKEK